ncbi:MAG TPA: dihydrolipoamide acetyltransferase family protein [Acidimicrobiales bacterium]|jgi:2-oxoglutarate dehydrogenase E2 component (dihydrolipoamide succinyltransferase)|nr:dihydrolipoamide acetyltransferase family protein [Acidimicrobiales bacterium]
MADVTMPQLGETVTEGTITKWFKQVGDQIAEDEVLFEVSTDKVDSEVPSPAAGYVSEIKVPEGETVDVGVVLAVIADAPPGDGEAPAAEPDATGEDEGADAGAEPEPEAEAPPEPETEEEAAPTPEPSARAEPEPKPQPAAGAAPPARSDDGGAATDRVLSPVVRRLLAENDLDPSQVTGTGSGGRITRNDVLAVIESKPQAKAAPSRPAPAERSTPPAAATAAAPAAPVEPGQRDTPVPYSNIRKRTAEHMVRSKQTSAHVYAAIEVDYEAVEQVRRAERDSWKAEEGFSLTYLPFVSRAVIDAIREFPEVNSTMGDNELIVHNYVNLGVAVDLDFKGLMVPVIHDADAKRMRAIAREISDLAARARSKKLSPDEIVNSTFTITNPGPFGTLLTLPIINQPQVAILSTDGVRRRPVVVDLPDGSEGIAIHSIGNIALAWDHRAFDGAYASAFLRDVKTRLETHDWAQEL